MRGSELLNRQLAFYSTPNLKLVISKALEDIGNEGVYHEEQRLSARSLMIDRFPNIRIKNRSDGYLCNIGAMKDVEY